MWLGSWPKLWVSRPSSKTKIGPKLGLFYTCFFMILTPVRPVLMIFVHLRAVFMCFKVSIRYGLVPDPREGNIWGVMGVYAHHEQKWALFGELTQPVDKQNLEMKRIIGSRATVKSTMNALLETWVSATAQIARLGVVSLLTYMTSMTMLMSYKMVISNLHMSLLSITLTCFNRGKFFGRKLGRRWV